MLTPPPPECPMSYLQRLESVLLHLCVLRKQQIQVTSQTLSAFTVGGTNITELFLTSLYCLSGSIYLPRCPNCLTSLSLCCPQYVGYIDMVIHSHWGIKASEIMLCGSLKEPRLTAKKTADTTCVCVHYSCWDVNLFTQSEHIYEQNVIPHYINH